MSGDTGNDNDGPKVSRAHVESHSGTTPERTVTWPVKDADVLIGTVRLSKGVHECVLPDGTVVETFKSLNFAVEFLHQRERPIWSKLRLRRPRSGNARSRPSSAGANNAKRSRTRRRPAKRRRRRKRNAKR